MDFFSDTDSEEEPSVPFVRRSVKPEETLPKPSFTQENQQSASEGVHFDNSNAAPKDDSWEPGLSLPADINTRCHSAMSNWSETSSPFASRRRPASSLSALHEQSLVSAQQLHDLRLAAVSGNLLTLKSVLDGGVCVDQALRLGWSALMFACSNGQAHAVKLLLGKGANPNFHKEMFTPLMAACASSLPKKDSDKGGSQAKQEEQDKEGGDRLVSCVQLLVSAGAEVNAAERHKMTPLMFACKGDRSAIVALLIKAGAQLNMQDNKGWSALCWACHGGHSTCASLLLEAAADASLATLQGQTAAELARAQHYHKLAEVVETAALGSPISAPALKELAVGPIAPVPVPSSCSDLDMVLAGLELNSLAPLFAKHKVDLAGFLRLSADELRAMGVEEVGVQHRLLTAIAEMHRKAWQPTSIAPLNTKPYISLVDATSMLSSVKKHVTFLEATLAFLRQQLESSPSSHHLRHNTTDHNIGTLIATAEEANQAINRLSDSTKYLSAHLHKLSSDSSHMPADLLCTRGPDVPSRWSRSVTAAALTAAVAIAALCWCRPNVFPAPKSTVLLDC